MANGIQNTHPEYDAVIDAVDMTRKAFEGEVKDFIPKLSGQTNSQYETYRSRAAYYNVTERTTLALIGALVRKRYTLEGVVGDEPVLADDCSFEEFIQQSYLDLMLGGRIGLMVDYSEDYDSPYIVKYCTEDITNWCDTYIVLREHYYGHDPKDPYKTVKMCRYRELFLDDEGFYSVRLWEKKGGTDGKRGEYVVVEEMQPTYRGQRLEFIPFVFVSPYDTTYSNVCKPVLYTLASLNIEHFKISTDIAHGAHFLALPTPWIAGSLSGEQQTIRLGTDEFIQMQQGSSIGYLEFSGSGMSFLMNLQGSKEEQMFSLGSRLLQYKKGVESSDALQVRLGSESASLNAIASSLESGLIEILEIYNTWFGSPEQEVELHLNKDFSPAPLTPQELAGLIQAYSQGVLTLDSLLKRLYEGEVIDDVEEEKEGLAEEETEVTVTPPVPPINTETEQ